MTLHEDVFKTIAAFEATKATTDQEIIDELMARGYDRLRAELLTVFVPLGMARAVIARLPTKPPLRLPDHVVILAGDRQLSVKLASVPEFQTARHVGEETFSYGILSKELFSWIVGFSVELKIINQLLYAGEEPGRATFAPVHLGHVANAPGFERWFEQVSTVAD